MTTLILQLKGIAATLETADTTLVEIGPQTELPATKLDGQAAAVVEFMIEKLGLDVGDIPEVLRRADFWVRLLSGLLIVDEAANLMQANPPDKCPACGGPDLEPVEEDNVTLFGTEWTEHTWTEWVYFCLHCESAGTLQEIEAQRDLVMPYRGRNNGS